MIYTQVNKYCVSLFIKPLIYHLGFNCLPKKIKNGGSYTNIRLQYFKKQVKPLANAQTLVGMFCKLKEESSINLKKNIHKYICWTEPEN